MARRTFTCLGFEDEAATLWSTTLARGAGWSKNPVGRQITDRRALVRARAWLPNVYPLRDCSQSQVFVDEGVES